MQPSHTHTLYFVTSQRDFIRSRSVVRYIFSMRSIKTIGRMMPTMPRMKKQRPPRDDEEPLTTSRVSLTRDHAATADDAATEHTLHVPQGHEDGGESDGGQSTSSIVAPVLAKK